MNADDRTRRLAEQPVGKLLLTFSLPAIAGMVVASLYTIIDRAFLGHVVGMDAIGGLSICMPIAFVMMGVGMLIGVGSAALISIRLGQRRQEDAEVILGNAVALLLVATVVLSGAFLLALDPLLVTFGATARTLPHARQFMRIILLGSFFQHASFGLNAVIRAEGNPGLAMLTMFINAGLNIVLDALFIFGFGFGVTGAAVATVISQAVSAVWTIAHFRSRRSVLKLRLTNVIHVRWSVVRPALAIGLAPCCMHLVGSVTSLLINRGLSRYGGDAAISAYGVINSVAMLALMPVFGITQGVQPIIGYNYGAHRYDRVRQALKQAIGAATVILVTGFVVMQAFPAALIRGFADDPELRAIGVRGMRICMLMMPVVAFQVVSANFFQAIGKARTAIVLSLLRQLIVLLPMLIVLPRLFGLDGVWGAGPVADGVATLLTGFALARQLRKMPKAAAAPVAEGAMVIEPSMGDAR